MQSHHVEWQRTVLVLVLCLSTSPTIASDDLVGWCTGGGRVVSGSWGEEDVLVSAVFFGNDLGFRSILEIALPEAACIDVYITREADPAQARQVLEEVREQNHHTQCISVYDFEDRLNARSCRWPGYHVVMEDSFVFPPDHIVLSRVAVDNSGKRAAVGLHGFVWNHHFIKRGMPFRTSFRPVPLGGFGTENTQDLWVDVLRLGTVTFHASSARLDPFSFCFFASGLE
eukprot:453917-Rhodomonas_salina.2